MSNLNKLLAYSMCEEMEYNLFNDEECVATDIIGDIEDEPDGDKSILYDNDKNIKEGFLSKFKKPKAEENPKMELRDLEKIGSEILPVLKSIVNKYNSDKKVNTKCIELFKNYLKGFDEDDIEGDDGLQKMNYYIKKNKAPKFSIPYIDYASGNNCLMFEVCNEGQYIREALSPVIVDMINELKKNQTVSKYIYKIDNGDGDEGCIYIEVKGDL